MEVELKAGEKKIRNNTIEIAKLIAAIMVVAIHTHPLSDMNETLGYIADNVIPRPAVPLFFLISGYYFFRSDNKKGMIRKAIHQYVIVSVVYNAMDLFMMSGGGGTHTGVLDRIFDFFVFGSWYHLWYYPALIISMMIGYVTSIIKKERLLFGLSILLYIIGVIGCAYYELGIKILGLRLMYENSNFYVIRRIFMMGVPFFSAGLATDRLHLRLRGLNQKYLMTLAIGLFLSEFVLVVVLLKSAHEVVITFFLYPLVMLIFDWLLYDRFHTVHQTAKYAAKSSKIMYLYHPMLLMIPVINRQTPTLQFASVMIFFLVIGFFANLLGNKKLDQKEMK